MAEYNNLYVSAQFGKVHNLQDFEFPECFPPTDDEGFSTPTTRHSTLACSPTQPFIPEASVSDSYEGAAHETDAGIRTFLTQPEVDVIDLAGPM